jgi:uncharacterized protein (DUF58 family)
MKPQSTKPQFVKLIECTIQNPKYSVAFAALRFKISLNPPTTLLDPEFMRELEALRRRLDVRARSGAAGDRAARRRGGSAEFQEHRAYEPGDDPRRIDWLAFARRGEPVVKLFRSEEDVIVRLLIDASASLGYGDPVKLDVARRLAAAIGYMALSSSQRAQLIVARQRASGAAEIELFGPARRGRPGFVALLRDLDTALPGGRADLGATIEQAVLRCSRAGLLVVLSDFFDSGPVTHALGRARAAGHDVALIQIVARGEIEPTLEGDYTLVDSETGATVDVTMDPAAVSAYVLRLTGLVEELRGWARGHGASYIRTSSDEPLEGVVRRFVAREID